ncbi:hypothetical protein [Bacillus sp. CGMCC 1.16541]|nr:hypothetical protein [Bacillus sp. CGMCC 1.16541]
MVKLDKHAGGVGVAVVTDKSSWLQNHSYTSFLPPFTFVFLLLFY